MKIKLCIYITLVLLILFSPFSVKAVEIKSYLVTEEQEFVGNPSLNRTYFYKTIPINYLSGKVVLSFNLDGTGDSIIGEELFVSVGDDTFTYKSNLPACFGVGSTSMKPLDITHLLHKGLNNVRVTYKKIWCNKQHISQMYLVHFDDYEPTTEPFLDLPWDYTGKGMSFIDAANKIGTFFDHQYPLVSAKWFINEPAEFSSHSLTYLGQISKIPYSSHDGYDYAFTSNVKLNDYVLAAASGIATFHNDCKDCGNAIHIDHGNGYQTRYYHLQPDGLITNNPNTQVNVANRQQIGKVGLTGNTNGAHIHFMLVQDKNGDGSFEDNIPDGIVDPYGWQGGGEDPWPAFSFMQNGEQKTGAKSTYLWKHSIQTIKKTLTPQGGIFTNNRYTFNFPKDAVGSDVIFSLKPVQYSEPSATLQPIGYVIDATADDGFGNLITQFNKLFTISMKILLTDYSRYVPESLSIYSSSDGENWQKEDTQIDLINRTATTQVNHLTQFAFMGEKLDSIAPESALFINNAVAESKYSSPVKTDITATDEPSEHSLGIDYTLYKINDSEWQQYTDSFELTETGTYVISYYSVDKDGNVEDTKTTEFEIIPDTTQLEFLIFYDFESEQFIVGGSEPDYEVITTSSTIKNGIANSYTISTPTQNQSILKIKHPNKTDRVVMKFETIQYDQSEVIDLGNHRLVVRDKVTENNVEKNIQIFQTDDEERIRLAYNKNKDITNIIIKKNGQIISTEKLKGFKRLIIGSNNGILQPFVD